MFTGKHIHERTRFKSFLADYTLNSTDTQTLLTEEGLLQDVGLIPCNIQRNSVSEITYEHLRHVSKPSSQTALSRYSDLFLPNQFMSFLRTLLDGTLKLYSNSSILEAEKALFQIVQSAVFSKKVSISTLLAAIRSYPSSLNTFLTSQRFLLIAFLQQLLNADSSTIQSSIKLAYASLISEQSSLSMWQQKIRSKSSEYYADLSSMDVSHLSHNLIMEYSPIHTDTNLFYSQKLLDYLWCTSKSPSLGALTLSTIGPSLYTYHKPVFNNSLAVFSVTLGHPNTVLCDPLQFSVYNQRYLNSSFSSIANSEEGHISSQLAALEEEETNATIYSYRSILSSFCIMPSVYLSPVIATGNMTPKALQLLADSGFYTTTDKSLYSIDIPDLSLHCQKTSSPAISSVIVGLGTIRNASIVSTSNLYAYSGRMFVAEHMDSFSLACCLPGMAYRLAIFHGFPESQKKAAEK